MPVTRASDAAERRRLPIPTQRLIPADRTPEQEARAGAVVAELAAMDEWHVARWCELILRSHLGPLVVVRPARPIAAVA